MDDSQVIKYVYADSTNRDVTVAVSGANTIDGGSSANLNANYMALTFLWNGISWSIV